MTKEELEKEAEKYAEQCYGWTNNDQVTDVAIATYITSAESREKRIEELETRCTELFLQNNEFAERFEKSIGIIKGLLSCCRNYPQENAKKMEQAEQFIKEIEK